MAKALFTESARKSLASIFRYLTGPCANPQAARTLAGKVEAAIAQVEGHPESCALCAEARLRRMGCRKAHLGDAYLMLYRVEGGRVVVLRFCHSQQAYWHLL